MLVSLNRYIRGAGKSPGSRHDSPDELKRGSFHFLPDYGTILPSTGATFCHCQAQNDASGEKFREVYHRHSEYAFRLQEAWFCSGKTLLSILPFTLHLFAGNPDKHRGCEIRIWRRVAMTSRAVSTFLRRLISSCLLTVCSMQPLRLLRARTR